MVVCLGEQGLESDYPVFMDWRCGSSGGTCPQARGFEFKPQCERGGRGEREKKRRESSKLLFIIHYFHHLLFTR
jgi:hypothetical protein